MMNMATIEAGLGTAGYGYSAEAAASGMFDPSMIGAGANATDWTSLATGAANVVSGITRGVSAASPYAALMLNQATAESQKASAYYQQGLYEVQAIDTLRLAQIRTDQDQKYAAIQAGRKLLQAEQQARNYQIAGNTLLRNMQRTNAAVRARAAANGVVFNEGSAAGVQSANVEATYRDVGITDLNALTARIMGFEDAGAMLLAAKEQADLTMNAAETQARQLRTAGDFAVRSGGLLSNATLTSGVMDFAKTVVNPFK
jgi:hypothetical protein